LVKPIIFRIFISENEHFNAFSPLGRQNYYFIFKCLGAGSLLLERAFE